MRNVPGTTLRQASWICLMSIVFFPLSDSLTLWAILSRMWYTFTCISSMTRLEMRRREACSSFHIFLT